MSIDREEFTKIILNDGSIGSSNFVPTNLAYNKDGNDYRDLVGDQGLDYDLEKAKEYCTVWRLPGVYAAVCGKRKTGF